MYTDIVAECCNRVSMTLVTNRVMVNVYMVYDLYPKPVCVDHVSAGNLVAIG